MSYRKLRVVLNTKQAHESRVMDIASGEDLLVEDLQIRCGRDTQYVFEVQLTLKGNIEIVLAEKPAQEEQKQLRRNTYDSDDTSRA